MLNILRKKGVAKKILWAVAIVIIISFGFFGRASILQRNRPITFAGKIFHKKISFGDFEKIYKDNYIQAMIRHGENFNNVRDMLNLDAETWDRIILLHEAQKRKIRVTDKEVIDNIAETPFFKRNNQFDALLYNDILRRIFRINPRDYEESVRDTLKILKLYESVTKDITITDQEIFEAFRKQNEKVQISYVLISPELFKEDVTCTEEEMNAYYQEHKLAFLKPPMINVEYISLPLTTEEEEETPVAEGTPQPEQDQAETKSEKPETENKEEEPRQKAISIYYDLLENPDMTAVAQTYQTEAKTSGLFSTETPPLNMGWSYAMFNKVFKMGLHEISEPIETDRGIFIVKIKEKNDAYTPTYDEAKEDIRQAVLREKARGKAKLEAKKILEQLKGILDETKVKDFLQAAKQIGVEIYQTPVFPRGQYLPRIGISKEFQEAAFALNEKNPVSDVVETEKGFCILHLDTYIPAEQKVFENEKDMMAQQLIVQKKMKAFTNFQSQLRIKAKLEDNVSKWRDQQGR